MIPGSNDPPDITLQEITFETVRAIISLGVNSEQRRYVAPNATSIAEGLLNPGGWIRAIYAGEVPVGFLMLLDPNVPGAKTRSPIDNTSVYLWRLMVDHQFQRRGYAKRALDLVCDHARRVGATRLITSFVPGEHGPERFYLNYGFIATGLTRANGTELELQLVL
jgi:diamine N-acetyltransferase